MHKIMCFDENGNTIDRLTQYDINQTLYINWDYSVSPVFQFSNEKNDRILVVKGEIIKGDLNTVAKVNIPNILLTEAYPIKIYVYLEQESETGYLEGNTVFNSIIPVNKKDKPEDYEYFENTEYISWVKLEEELMHRINKLDADATLALRKATSPTIDVRKNGDTATVVFTDFNGTKTLKITGNVTVELS